MSEAFCIACLSTGPSFNTDCLGLKYNRHVVDVDNKHNTVSLTDSSAGTDPELEHKQPIQLTNQITVSLLSLLSDYSTCIQQWWRLTKLPVDPSVAGCFLTWWEYTVTDHRVTTQSAVNTP